MQKLAVLVGSLMFGMSLAHTASFSQSSTPTTASYTMTLSGECTGKITQTINYVGIDYSYSESEGSANNSSSSVYVEGAYYGSDYFYTEAYGRGLKLSEVVNKGKKTTRIQHSYGYPRVWPISEEPQFSEQIKCKGGRSLPEVMAGWELYIDEALPHSFKSDVKLVSSAGGTDYTLKQAFTGVVELPERCRTKGLVGSEKYTVTCEPNTSIKIKVNVAAKGTFSLL